MKQHIIDNLESPENLERLYRTNKKEFLSSLAEISDHDDSELLKFWRVRLTHESEPEPKGFNKLDLQIVIILSLVTAIFAKIPVIFQQVNDDFFYMRDMAIIVFNGLILYAFWQNKIFDKKKIAFYAITILALLLFVNLLPSRESDSLNLALLHVPLFLWCLFGLAYISFDIHNTDKRMEFIRFNGELLVMTGLIIIAGGILTGLTLGLFEAINVQIESFYLNYIVISGAVASPILAYYLIRLYPDVTRKISPVIALVFTPLVLITLAVYLVSLIFSGNRILEDRDLLLLLNVMLIGVMALIVFSVSELDKTKKKNFNVLILLLLAVLAIVINSIALTAIITRVTYGLTPNRTVVLISNILIFVNLIIIARNLFKAYYNTGELDSVEKSVARYLPVYLFYTMVVIFILPFVFGMK